RSGGVIARLSPDEKVEIVLAVLRGEVGIAMAARRERVSKSSIEKWRDDFLRGGREALVPRRGGSARPSAHDAALAARGGVLRSTRGEVATPPPAHDQYDSDSEAHPPRYIAALRKHWLVVVVVVVVAVASAVAYSTLSAKQFNAEADIVVSPIPSTDSSL